MKQLHVTKVTDTASCLEPRSTHNCMGTQCMLGQQRVDTIKKTICKRISRARVVRGLVSPEGIEV